VLNLESFSFVHPIRVEFGRDVSKAAGKFANAFGWHKVMIITDKGVVAAGLLRGVSESLSNEGIAFHVFDRVVPNPTENSVLEAFHELRNIKADCLIAIGGGSSIDTAKVTALLETNGGKPQDYEIKGIEDVSRGKFQKQPMPLITIPTTAGTGSEVDVWAVIIDSERKFKMSLGQPPPYPGGPYLGASLALSDPGLTLTLPPIQTASTGIDAMFHAMEAFLSGGSHPIVAVLAPEAIELAYKNLTTAYQNGHDIQARENMLLAATLGGLCINLSSCGVIHALGEALGGLYPKLSHGQCLAALAPYVMQYHSRKIPEKLMRLNRAMNGEETSSLPMERAALAVAKKLERLNGELRLPHSLNELGIDKKDIGEMVKRASYTFDNPGLVRETDLTVIANNAFEGTPIR
jgi:choline dehydrogenase